MARVRQCYYEVMGVPMDADENAIKKAYRKLALEWHPDKNMHRVDEATEKFRVISDAYQVLSDPRERAWYDSHRESILRGGDGTAGSDAVENLAPNIYQYFVIPSKADFFEYYSNAFDEILQAERIDMGRQGKTESSTLPRFGNKETSFAEVKHFYNCWENFTTKMSFSWKDKYDTREAENRYQRRYVEKLNESERATARREYIDSVRSLVAFCKKRDERWMQGLIKQEQEEREKRERREQAEQERKAQKAAEKLAIQKELEEERRREEEERRLRGEIDDAEEEEEEEEDQIWSCLVCKKDFKSEKQMQNHEGSKKHKDAVKAYLKKGGKLEGIIAEPAAPKEEPKNNDDEAANGLEPCPSCGELIPNDSQDCPKCQMPVFLGMGEEEEVNDVQASEVEASGITAQSDSEADEDESEDDHIDLSRFAKSKPKAEVEEEENDRVETLQREEDNVDDVSEQDDVDSELNDTAKTAKQGEEKKTGKAKQKRLEREARKAKQEQEKAVNGHVCGVCGEEFTSRTRLFKHVEDLDHAVPLDSANQSHGGGGGKGKKKSKGKH